MARLTGSGVASDDEFGTSVDVSGDTIVVGTEYTDAAFVYRTSDGGATWAAVTTLEGSDDFGQSVAIDGDTIVTYYRGASGGDATYVYRTSDGGATYAEVAKCDSPGVAEPRELRGLGLLRQGRRRLGRGRERRGLRGDLRLRRGGAAPAPTGGAARAARGGASRTRRPRRRRPRPWPGRRARRRASGPRSCTATTTRRGSSSRPTRAPACSNSSCRSSSPDDCWNADKDWEDHVQCSSSVAALVRRSDAAEAASNDGLNCPLGGGPAISRYSSDAPTITPVPSSSPYPTTAAPTSSLAPTTPSPTTAQPTPQPSTAAPSLAGSRAPTTAYPTATPTTPSPSATPTPRPTPMPTTATPTSSATTQGLFALKLVVDYGDLTAADGRRAVSGRPRFSGTRGGHGLRAGHLRARFRETAAPDDGLRRDDRPRGDVPPEQRGRHPSRLVGQLQDSLGDGSFTAALETAAAGTDSSLASL